MKLQITLQLQLSINDNFFVTWIICFTNCGVRLQTQSHQHIIWVIWNQYINTFYGDILNGCIIIYRTICQLLRFFIAKLIGCTVMVCFELQFVKCQSCVYEFEPKLFCTVKNSFSHLLDGIPVMQEVKYICKIAGKRNYMIHKIM